MQPIREDVGGHDPANRDGAARAAYRRRRALNATLSAMAAVALVITGTQLLRDTRSRAAEPESGPLGVAATATAVPTTTVPVVTEPTPSPVSTSPGSTAPKDAPKPPTTSRTAPGCAVAAAAPANVPTMARMVATDSPSPSPPASAPPDLHASGPGSVTLVPDCTVYRGTVTITVKNTGSPFDWGNVLVHIPAGVQVDFTAGDPGFFGCGFIEGPTYYFCAGPVVPAFGGVFTRVVHLVANYAPQANAMDLGVFSIQYQAKPDSVGADPTPDDNTVSMEVLLAKA